MCRMSKFLSDSCAVIKMFDTEASALLTAGPGHPPVNSPQPFLATSGCSEAVYGPGQTVQCVWRVACECGASRHRQADRWQPAWHGHVTQRTRRTQRTANQKRTWEIICFPSKMVQIKSNSMQVIQWHKSVFTVAWSWSCKYPALNVVHKIHKDVTLPT